MEKRKKLTTAAGAPVPDNQNAMTAGPRGPMLMQDVWYLEKLAHFDREVIPERRMHAKGSGAFGKFTVTHDITRYTKAKIFSEIGKETELFMRFSTVAGERGAADAERDIRGFAMKFYTEEGNWDLVGNNTPVFFLRDPHKFPDLNRAVKRDPHTNLRSATNNWDFWTSLPEALHQVTIVMSDRGIPASYRHMHGFGSHTFSMINAKNERVWVKFHLRTQQGIKNLTDQEAEAIVAKDRESHQRDLFDSIAKGDFPRWTMYIQVMTEEQARNMPYNPFDLTKVWYKKEFPLIEVGVLELNRNPENYFQDVEQAAFNPGRRCARASASRRIKCCRAASSPTATRSATAWVSTTTRSRSTAPNMPRPTPPTAMARCGWMATHGATIGYEPNSFGEWQEQPEFKEPPLDLFGAADSWNFREDDCDYYTQPGKLFRLMSKAQQQVLFENTARAMGDAPNFIKIRHIGNCYQADPQYGEGVAEALGLRMDTAELIK